MKIEKINENQVRFTLTRDDLAEREIKISELAYGSQKAKNLFREMMEQAASDVGFEVNGMPLMVEAIPVATDSIVLIVTKVENPDELDSRFSRFSSEDGKEGSGPKNDKPAVSLSGADEILDLISRLSHGRKNKNDEQDSADKKDVPAENDQQGITTDDVNAKISNGIAGAFAAAKAGARGPIDGIAGKKASDRRSQVPGDGKDDIYRLTRFFLFHDLETAIKASHMADASFDGHSSFYKNPDDGNFYLIIRKADADARSFTKVCNVMTEYAEQIEYTDGMDAFFTEHMKVIVAENALASLKAI